MHDDCSRLFQKLETQRTDTLAELGRWSPGCLIFHATPGSWSAIEVLDHVVRAEAGTVDGVRLGLVQPQPLGEEDRPGLAALDRALRSEQTFEVPPGAAAIFPDSQSTLPEVSRRWAETRAELAQLVHPPAAADAGCGVFRHPFAGWMTFAEVLRHFDAHLFHHWFQLERLRASSAHLRHPAGEP